MNLQKTLGTLLLFILSLFSVNIAQAYTQLELLNDGCKSNLTTTKYPSLNFSLLNVIGNIGTNIHKKYVYKDLDEQITRTSLLISVLEGLYNNRKDSLTSSQKEIVLSLTDLFVCKKTELEAKKNGVSNTELLDEVNQNLGNAVNDVNSGIVKDPNCKYDQCFEGGYYVINEDNDFDKDGKKEGCNESGLEDAGANCILKTNGTYVAPLSSETTFDRVSSAGGETTQEKSFADCMVNKSTKHEDFILNYDRDNNGMNDCFGPVGSTGKLPEWDYCSNLKVGGLEWYLPDISEGINKESMIDGGNPGSKDVPYSGYTILKDKQNLFKIDKYFTYSSQDGDYNSRNYITSGKSYIYLMSPKADMLFYNLFSDKFEHINVSSNWTNGGKNKYIVRCVARNYIVGDGIITKPYEQCDDWNTKDGDGCSSKGQIEKGYALVYSRCVEGNVSDVAKYPDEIGNLYGYINATSNKRCDDGNNTNLDGCYNFERENSTTRACSQAALHKYELLKNGDLYFPKKCISSQERLKSDGNFRSTFSAFSVVDFCSLPAIFPYENKNYKGFRGIIGTEENSTTVNTAVQTNKVISVDEVVNNSKTSSNIQNYCGDGWFQEDEECEDFNTQNGDGCSSTCKLEDQSYLKAWKSNPISLSSFKSNTDNKYSYLTLEGKSFNIIKKSNGECITHNYVGISGQQEYGDCNSDITKFFYINGRMCSVLYPHKCIVTEVGPGGYRYIGGTEDVKSLALGTKSSVKISTGDTKIYMINEGNPSQIYGALDDTYLGNFYSYTFSSEVYTYDSGAKKFSLKDTYGKVDMSGVNINQNKGKCIEIGEGPVYQVEGGRVPDNLTLTSSSSNGKFAKDENGTEYSTWKVNGAISYTKGFKMFVSDCNNSDEQAWILYQGRICNVKYAGYCFDGFRAAQFSVGGVVSNTLYTFENGNLKGYNRLGNFKEQSLLFSAYNVR